MYIYKTLMAIFPKLRVIGGLISNYILIDKGNCHTVYFITFTCAIHNNTPRVNISIITTTGNKIKRHLKGVLERLFVLGTPSLLLTDSVFPRRQSGLSRSIINELGQ